MSHKAYGQNKKELNALIEKKFQIFVKNKKKRKTKKEIKHFQELQVSNDEEEKSISGVVESKQILSSSSE